MSSAEYTGRFAPSPSGPLHFGSLVTAVASYLDAKSRDGKWLVRMEDIDPPREQAGASDLILKALDVYGLIPDGDILFQSSRLEDYQARLQELRDLKCIFSCVCTRKTMATMAGICAGQCCVPTPDEMKKAYTLRFRPQQPLSTFDDRVFGLQTCDIHSKGYCSVKRKDGLFAYQLAVVVDDIFQGITHVVRGADLLEATHWQQGLFNALGHTPPLYAHVPLAMGANGKKLSKQFGAPGIPVTNPVPVLFQVLEFLQLHPPKALQKACLTEILDWGVHHWKLPVADKATLHSGEMW